MLALYLQFITLKCFYDFFSIGRKVSNCPNGKLNEEDEYKKGIKGFIKGGLLISNIKGSWISRNTNINFFTRFYTIYIALISLQILPWVQILVALVISIAYGFSTFLSNVSKKGFSNFFYAIEFVIGETLIAMILCLILTVLIYSPSVNRSKALIWIIVLGFISELLFILIKSIIILVKKFKNKKNKINSKHIIDEREIKASGNKNKKRELMKKDKKIEFKEKTKFTPEKNEKEIFSKEEGEDEEKADRKKMNLGQWLRANRKKFNNRGMNRINKRKMNRDLPLWSGTLNKNGKID